jgi:glycerol-3-phosphate acyltransferase PlsX
VASPRIGLMSIGEEEGKGNEVTKETYRILKETGLNFIGNAEGRDVFNGRADVVVCDGFVGNIVLKASESLGEMVWTSLKSELSRNPIRKAVGALAYPFLKDLKKRMDWAEYGGAPLLGVKGGCIVCHGRSNAKAIRNAIRVAREFMANRVDVKIREKIRDLHTREHQSEIMAR